MPTIACPIEGCTYITEDLTEAAERIALLQIHATTHTAPRVDIPSVKPEKVSRPKISPASSSEDWEYFKRRWGDYKTATKMGGTDINVQLLECCEETLRRDLHRSDKNISTKAETEILTAIQHLAVREENTMVSRVILQSMHQDRGEGVRNYAARLRGQADICKFTAKCDTCNDNINFTEQMIRDTLTRGLADSEIRQNILGNENQNMTLEEVLKVVEAKESGKRSEASLISTEGAHSLSNYRENTREHSLPNYWKNSRETSVSSKQKSQETHCPYCGEHSHEGGNVERIRRNVCTAFGATCKKCKRENHFTKMCYSRTTPKKSPIEKTQDEAGAMYELLCPAETITLDHHAFNPDSGWTRQRSQAQPSVNIHVKLNNNDYVHFGRPPPRHHRDANITAIADTGCQSPIISLQLLHKLGVKSSELIPVKHQMRAINQDAVEILGAVLLRLSGRDKGGNILETAQLCYVTTQTNNFYLSREACRDLGLISSHFPCIGESADSVYEEGERTCDCSNRTLPPPIPANLPFSPTEENRGKVKQWIKDYYEPSTFNVCEHQQLPLMEDPPLTLNIDPNAVPVAVHTPIPVPLHWQEEVKSSLDRDVRLGVIEPVPIVEPVTWCHRMVTCKKKNGNLRRTVDFQSLNAHSTRETHHTQSPFHQATLVPQNKKKSVFDAWNGYHSVPLRECDRHYITFITPWGRYRYKTTPQGFIASGDGYSRRYDEIVSNFPNKTKCIDDTCMWADSIEDCFYQACQWLEICGKNGITLNPDKFQFASDTVDFAGFEIGSTTIKPGKKLLQAIEEFPTPQNLTDIRSWFGIINQVNHFASTTTEMQPFRDLLKPSTTFFWDDHMQCLFDKSKSDILKEIEKGITIFEKNRKTCIQTDWCKIGTGFWLWQKHCSCPGDSPICCPSGWKVTFAGSRFNNHAESDYHPVEGEALAAVNALDQAKHFVLGCNDLILAVDHKPLLKIFGDRKLEDIDNPRLLNLKEKTLPFKFKVIHIPGEKHKAPDATSRHPVGPINPEKILLQDDLCDRTPLCGRGTTHDSNTTYPAKEPLVKLAAASLPESFKTVTWNRVREETTSDPIMQMLIDTIEDGFPDHQRDTPPQIYNYFRFRDNLATVDGVVLYGDRIVIPPALRPEVLSALHAAHQSVTPMTTRVEMSVFWPGISNQISELREKCHQCNGMAPSQPSAPPTPPQDATYPFQCICADYFQYKGSHYLVIVDRYSNWPVVKRTSAGGSDTLIKHLRETFTTYGIADEISSDGGPEFTASKTTDFLKDWGVHHRCSSVAFPHSNCRAELGVKTCKRMLADNTGPHGELDTVRFQRAILQYRNCPDQDTKMSPAMILFGRSIKDFIPVLPGKYRPHSTWIETSHNRELALRKRHFRAVERLSEHTHRLPELKVGNHVRIQNQTGPHPRKWDRTGTVIEVHQHDQYVVRVDGSGRVTLRNRKFLRMFTPYFSNEENTLIAQHLVSKGQISGSRPPMLSNNRTVASTPPPPPLLQLTPLLPLPPHPSSIRKQAEPPAALTSPRGRDEMLPETPHLAKSTSVPVLFERPVAGLNQRAQTELPLPHTPGRVEAEDNATQTPRRRLMQEPPAASEPIVMNTTQHDQYHSNSLLPNELKRRSARIRKPTSKYSSDEWVVK